jgi:hypothetical protein
VKAKLLHYDSPGFTGLTRLVAAATYLVRRYGLRFLSLVTACTARRYGPNWPKQIARVRLSVSLPFILSAREGRSLLHWAYLPPVTASYARHSSLPGSCHLSHVSSACEGETTSLGPIRHFAFLILHSSSPTCSPSHFHYSAHHTNKLARHIFCLRGFFVDPVRQRRRIRISRAGHNAVVRSFG